MHLQFNDKLRLFKKTVRYNQKLMDSHLMDLVVELHGPISGLAFI